jgi:ATP-dependent DNA helicase RecG
MEEQQLREIIDLGENQEIEFKESFSQQNTCKTLCGFGNILGGIIIYGVSDNREIKGINANIDELQKKISATSQCISPSPIITIEHLKVDKKDVIVTTIQKAIDNLYYTYEGAIYVRVGSTTKKLEGRNHLDFLRNKQILSFDEGYEDLVKINDLDIDRIKEYLEKRGQNSFLRNHSVEDFLISKKLATKNGKLKIKNSTVLLFSKNPQYFYPQNEVKLVKFLDNEPVEILSHKLIQKNLFDSIEESINFIKENVRKEIRLRGEAKSKEIYEYPLEAIREAIVNAVTHRDYFSRDSIQVYIFNNRIEITSPGSLPQGLTKELFGTISVRRNPITYVFLRDLGYVEGLGTGVPRMKNYVRKMNLRDPEFIFTESFFRVIFYNKKGSKKPIKSKEDLNERQINALDYLKRNKTIKSSTYEEINNVSHATAVKEINEMVEFKYLKKIGAYRGVYYILFK